MDTGVEYRTLPRYPGYRFGNDGSWWSRWNGKRKRKMGAWQQRAALPNLTGGRVQCSPRNADGKFVKRMLHRLILEAFRGPCPDGMECCHNDGNAGNNQIENLRWDTKTENASDRSLHGKTYCGERNSQAKLTDDKVWAIRLLYATGRLHRSLATQFGIAPSNVSFIVRRKHWTQVA